MVSRESLTRPHGSTENSSEDINRFRGFIEDFPEMRECQNVPTHEVRGAKAKYLEHTREENNTR